MEAEEEAVSLSPEEEEARGRTAVVALSPSREWRSMTFSACGGKAREPRCGG
jgi:hypothetical protein